jgi:hypothetical protein
LELLLVFALFAFAGEHVILMTRRVEQQLFAVRRFGFAAPSWEDSIDE